MTLRLAAAATLCIALIPGATRAEIGASDTVPAATLLLPYFEVDLAEPNGVTTLFSLANADTQPAVAHVTLWTNLAIPTLDFDIYLDGTQAVHVNLRDLFNGYLPQTQTTDFGCAQNLPPPPLPQTLKDHIIAAHSGNSSQIFGNRCSAAPGNDDHVRGYVTVDVVNSCNLMFPGDPGYFQQGGTGIASNRNVLWGDYQLIDLLNNFSQGEPLVHIEADSSLNSGYTFYGRFGSAEDNREPLAATWNARYRTIPSEGGDAQLLVWRDPKRTLNPFTCGTIPNPFPMGQTQIVGFNSESDPENLSSSGNPPQPNVPFPWASNSTQLGPFQDLNPTARSGWLYLNLNTTAIGAFINPNTQSFVTVVTRSQGRFSGAASATPLDNARTTSNTIIPF